MRVWVLSIGISVPAPPVSHIFRSSIGNYIFEHWTHEHNFQSAQIELKSPNLPIFTRRCLSANLYKLLRYWVAHKGLVQWNNLCRFRMTWECWKINKYRTSLSNLHVPLSCFILLDVIKLHHFFVVFYCLNRQRGTLHIFMTVQYSLFEELQECAIRSSLNLLLTPPGDVFALQHNQNKKDSVSFLLEKILLQFAIQREWGQTIQKWYSFFIYFVQVTDVLEKTLRKTSFALCVCLFSSYVVRKSSHFATNLYMVSVMSC